MNKHIHYSHMRVWPFLYNFIELYPFEIPCRMSFRIEQVWASILIKNVYNYITILYMPWLYRILYYNIMIKYTLQYTWLTWLTCIWFGLFYHRIKAIQIWRVVLRRWDRLRRSLIRRWDRHRRWDRPRRWDRRINRKRRVLHK